MSTVWPVAVAFVVRTNWTPVTLAPVDRNSARARYSPSTPPIDAPPLDVMRMNVLLVSTPVPSVTRLVVPLVAPPAVGQDGVAAAPPIHVVPRWTDAPSIVTTCQFTVTVVAARPRPRDRSRLVVVPAVHGAPAVARNART